MPIALLFKPFTLQEVHAITRAKSEVLEAWVLKDVLPLQRGDDGKSIGLNWMQAFAVYVGSAFLQEGSGPRHAALMTANVGHMSEDQLGAAFANNVPFMHFMPSDNGPMMVMVKAPDTPTGHRLRLDKLFAEFQSRVKDVFPDYQIRDIRPAAPKKETR